jgi:hypothetical protein
MQTAQAAIHVIAAPAPTASLPPSAVATTQTNGM